MGWGGSVQDCPVVSGPQPPNVSVVPKPLPAVSASCLELFKNIHLTHSGIIDALISEMKSSSCIIQGKKYCIIEQRMGAFIPHYAFWSLLPYEEMCSVGTLMMGCRGGVCGRCNWVLNPESLSRCTTLRLPGSIVHGSANAAVA